jgi:hypothetical protein
MLVLAFGVRPSDVNPFIKSISVRLPLAPNPAPVDGVAASLLFPNTPNRSSRLLLPEGALLASGEADRTGEPVKSSWPFIVLGGSFGADAGAAPSKSMSRRFSALP